MRVVMHTPYKAEPNAQGHSEREEVVWPEGWPIPREGEIVEAKGPTLLVVRSVTWYPHRDEEGGEPFVYIVLGPRR